MRFKYLLSIVIGLTLMSCATRHTQDIQLTNEQIAAEEKLQLAMSKKYKKKELKVKYTRLAVYEERLARIAPRLINAAKTICIAKQCVSSYKVVNKEILNAWADGKSINITPLMMDFFDNDNELSVVLAHELAHNTMDHINKSTRNTLLGSLVDLALDLGAGVNTGGAFGQLGQLSYSQEFENEADYVGIYILAKSGMPYKDAANIWRKFSLQIPESINSSFLSTHPSTPVRYLKIKSTIQEIEDKKNKHQKLIPNIKKDD